MSKLPSRFFFDSKLILRPSTTIYYFCPKVTIPTIRPLIKNKLSTIPNINGYAVYVDIQL